MKKILTLFAGLILSVQTTQAKESSLYIIFGEPGKPGVLKQLAAISNAADSSISVKPGQFTKQELLLRRSPYKNKIESEINLTEVRCQFAYDLHRFVAGKNRDYDSITCLKSSSNSAHGAKKVVPAYLPYGEQEGFANGWWTNRSRKYRESGAAEKKLFLHNAIVDATNLYGWYGRRVYGTAAYVAWEEAAMQTVQKKQ